MSRIPFNHTTQKPDNLHKPALCFSSRGDEFPFKGFDVRQSNPATG
jgi:hypothetical protein